MKKTKAQVDPMQIVILFIILAIVAGIVIYIFIKQSGAETGVIEDKISGLKIDTDSDGLPNSADPCPCDPVNTVPCTIKCAAS